MSRVALGRGAWFSLLLCNLSLLVLFSASPLFAAAPKAKNENRKIYLLHANTLTYNKLYDADRQVLQGDVRFRQDSCYMYCNLAYFYESTNSMKAFGNVRMEQGDTLFVACDSLIYDGNALYGELYGNVLLQHYGIHNDTRLHTDYMTYDRAKGEACYPNMGVMIDSLVHLRSLIGWYYPSTQQAFFQYEVEGRYYPAESAPHARGEMPRVTYTPNDNYWLPEYFLYSDTLRYDFRQQEATVLSPSRILHKETTLHTRRGYFNTGTGVARLYLRSWIDTPGRFATADTLLYHTRESRGEAFGRVHAVDSTDCMALRGDYAFYDTPSDSLPQYGYLTGHALAMEYSSGDTLFLHADTLKAFTVVAPHEKPQTLAAALDSLPASAAPQDTMRYMQAYYNVRYYRSDLQGVCDSLIYADRDSLATFMGNPVMWNGQYQITGDTIFAVVTRKGLDRAMIRPAAFLTQSHDDSLRPASDSLRLRRPLRFDTLHYDQIKGNELVCLFDSGKVSRLDMQGNVTILYYPEEDTGALIGLNQMVGNYLTVWFKNQKMDQLKLWPNVVGSLTPTHLVTPELLHLDGFRWMSYLRPNAPVDVMRSAAMKEEDKQETIHLFDEDELNGY